MRFRGLLLLGGLLASLFPATAGAQSWVTVASMSTEHALGTATLLNDGRVLVAGGYRDSGGPPLTTAELFDPATRTWTPAGDMATGRARHTATLLNNGKVLVAGGYKDEAGNLTNTAELYDPVTNSWSPTADMGVARATFTASPLADGRVLVAGGGPAGAGRTSAEIYDPAGLGTWTPTGSMAEGRTTHSAVVLADGTVLVAGGVSGFPPPPPPTLTETYDPDTGAWSEAGNLAGARYTSENGPPLVRLPSGKVLIAGSTQPLESGKVELWDPGTRTWSAGPDMLAKRTAATGVLLPSGKALIVGADTTFEPTAEIYDPASNTWAYTGRMQGYRGGVEVTLLQTGKVLVVGGYGGVGPGIGATAELGFAPKTTFTSGPDGPSSSSSATFTFDSTEPGSTFHCALDGAAFEPCTSPKTYAGLADGSHTLTVRATDSTGLVDPTPPSRAWSVDATSPSVGLSAPLNGSVTSSAAPGFAGTAGTAGTADGDALTVTVKVYSGSTASGDPVQTLATSRSGSNWSVQPSIALADGVYTAQAEQADSVGNIGFSPAVTFTVDTVAPEAFGLVAPADGAFTADATPTLTWQAAADNAGGSGVTRLEVLIDGAVRDGNLAPDATEFTPSDALADGGHTWSVRAFDAAGNTRETGLSSFTIDTVSPQPPPGPVGVSINGGATYTNDADIKVAVIWPPFTTNVLLSNDGGFQQAGEVPVAQSIPWRLSSSGPERLPKTIYARFQPVGTGTYQDDIILDETAPLITLATVTVPASPAPAASVAATRKYVIRLRARDRTSGVSRAQLAVRRRKPMRARRYRGKLTVRAVRRPRFVRVRDRAGNWSRWKSLDRV